MNKNNNINETHVIWIVAAVMFVHITDFMMTMPLGPDLGLALDIDLSKVGLTASFYTASAALSGLVSARFLDRFNRRPALALLAVGIGLATIAGTLAWDFKSLMGIRFIAGTFGGPATAMAITVMSDVIPPQRRGWAMGRTMTAFSVAAVIGVPLALKLSEIGGWTLPFFVVGSLALVVAAWIWFGLPDLKKHLDLPLRPHLSLLQTLKQPLWFPALFTTALVMTTGFIIIPNIPAWLLSNTSTSRGDLAGLYAIGGIFSVVILNITGPMVDKFGATRVAVVGTCVFIAAISTSFLLDRLMMPAAGMFILFMMGMGIRNIAQQTQITLIPRPDQRAGFQSLNAASQNLSSALGAGLATLFLSLAPDGSMIGMPALATMTLALSLGFPFLTYYLQTRLVGHKH